MSNYPRRSSLPSMVQMLLIANGLLFLLEFAGGNFLLAQLALWPLSGGGGYSNFYGLPGFQPWQLVTYAFLHGGVLHLLLNLYALWLFGTRMESVWGSRNFAIYYFVCVVGAGLVQLLVASASGEVYPTVGASGAVFGLLLAFGLTYPDEMLVLVFPPVALKAKWFVLIYAAFELWAGVTGTQAGVAHFAHLGGMLFGYLLLRYWRDHPPAIR